MKNITKILALAFVAFVFSTSVNAQSTASATASATIISPITITKTVDLDFGNVAASALAGTVTIDPAGNRSTTGGVSLPVIPGTVTAASFNVAGQANYTYAITLPASVTITNGTDNMTVNGFTSTPTPTGTLDVTGNEVLNVGATLNVGASQAAGLYTTTTPFDVTVNYN